MQRESIQNICVVMLGILGDVLTRTPTVRELRKIFPRAKITCIVDPIGYEVLQNSPDIDRFKIAIRSKNPRYLYLKNKAALYLHLIFSSYDLFVDLYGNASTRLMAKLSLSRMQAIVADGQLYAKNLEFKLGALAFPNPHHLSNVSLQVLRCFWSEIISLNTCPVVDLENKALKTPERLYIDNLIAKHKNFFLISAGSGDVKKMIPPRLCESISQFVSATAGITPFVLYNPGERDVQADISQRLTVLGLVFEKLCPLSLAAVIYLIRRASFVVVSDSGVLHLTVAVGTPFLGIFPYTPPEEVVPEQGIFEVCFKPDPNGRPYGSRGLVYGDQSISETDILPRLKKLLHRIGVSSDE